jgi:hypothetical protein
VLTVLVARRLTIDEEHKAKQIFISAEGFRHSADILEKRNLRLGQQRVVLLSFAFELYLKCFILLTQRETARGHNTEKLFSKLPPKFQQRIKAEFRRIYKTKAFQDAKEWFVEAGLQDRWIEDFDEALRVSALAFERFRYAHEGLQGTNWWAPAIMKAVRKYILKVRPQWDRQWFRRH